MKKLFVLAPLLTIGTGASASSPAAWNQMNTRVNRACIAMADLARPVLLAKRISFSDAIGTEVRMIRGTDHQRRARHLLCAYNRATGRAEVADADAWTGPVTKP